jgi:hypothetical protein
VEVAADQALIDVLFWGFVVGFAAYLTVLLPIKNWRRRRMIDNLVVVGDGAVGQWQTVALGYTITREDVGNTNFLWADTNTPPRQRARDPRTPSIASVRGMQLLFDNLTPAQLRQYDAYGYFEITGGSTGKTYRIEYGSSGNIVEMDKKGNPVCRMCVMTEMPLVPGDVMLAQKIGLEVDEKATLAVANRLGVTGFQVAPVDDYPF